MPLRLFVLLLVLTACVIAGGCTSFSTVRSAEIHPGLSSTLQAGASTPPGDGAAWFWAFDCSQQCDRPMTALDLNFAVGRAGRTPYTLGGGINGLLFPYMEGYVQMGGGSTNPYGVGARLGLPLQSWREHQIYGRYDVRLGSGQRLLLNPGLFLHEGTAPNGEHPGHLLAFVQGIGLLLPGESVSYVPAVSAGVGRGKRKSRYEAEDGPFTSAFATVSISVTVHRRRTSAGSHQ